MNAIQLMEQVKALPPGEQLTFAELLRQWHPPEPRPATAWSDTRVSQWPDFMARLRLIYGDKVTSDSQALISGLRGER